MKTMSSQVSDENQLHRRLLRDTADGSRESFSRLYRHFYNHLVRFSYRYVSDTNVAEEVVNDTMLIVWQKAAEFRGEAKVSTWIMGIAVKVCMNARRRNKSAANASEHELEQLAVGTFVDDLERQQLLAVAIGQLGHEHQATIELSYGHGYSCEEIAQMMECPKSTVKTRLHYARKYLRTILSEMQQTPRPPRASGDERE